MNLWIEVAKTYSYKEDRTQYRLHLKANVALEIIKHCALVTGLPDGEDSAGRSKTTNMAARETAVRACDIADSLVREFEARQWLAEPEPVVEENN